MDTPHIGVVVRRLNHEIGRSVSALAAKEFGDSATGVHSFVLAYLYDHREEDIFQKDLERRFSVRRSTMTVILQLMEKNGMIERAPVSYDARLKKLILTPKAIASEEGMKKRIDELEAKMAEGIPDSEMEIFRAVAEKIRENLGFDGEGEENRPPKPPKEFSEKKTKTRKDRIHVQND